MQVAAVLVLAALVCAVTLWFVWSRAYKKWINLHYRFLWLEESSIQISHHLGDIEAQRQRTIGRASLSTPRDTLRHLDGGQWECLAGGPKSTAWAQMKRKRARGLASFDGKLYVGLERYSRGDAEVWVMDEADVWLRIGGLGLNDSWTDADEVPCLAVHEGQLVAGIASQTYGASVWTWNGQSWRCIGGEADGSWPAGRFLSAQCLAVRNRELFVGFWCRQQKQDCRPMVYRYNGDGWQPLSADEWTTAGPEQGVYVVHVGADDAIYAGHGGDTGAGTIWRFGDDGWTCIGGDAQGLANVSCDHVLALATLDGRLVASFERVPAALGDFSSIWSFEDGTWKPIGLGGIPRPWSETHSFNALFVYRGTLLLGSGGTPGGKASVWKLGEDGMWELFAGFGQNGSWGAPDGKRPLSHRTSREYVYRMIEHQGALIVGFGSSLGCAQVWRYSHP